MHKCQCRPAELKEVRTILRTTGSPWNGGFGAGGVAGAAMAVGATGAGSRPGILMAMARTADPIGAAEPAEPESVWLCMDLGIRV